MPKKIPRFGYDGMAVLGNHVVEMNVGSPKLWAALLGVAVCLMAVPVAQAGLGDALSDTTAAVGGALEAGSSALGEAAPVTEAVAPVTEAAAPVVESVTAPVGEVVVPVVEVVEETTQPVVDAVAPVVEAAAPVVDLVESVVGSGGQAPDAPSATAAGGSSAPGGASGPAPGPQTGPGAVVSPSGPVGSPASGLAPSTGIVLASVIEAPRASFGPAEDIAATALPASVPLADGGSSILSNARSDRVSPFLGLPSELPGPALLSPSTVAGVGSGVVLLGLALLGLLLFARPGALRRLALDGRGPPRPAFFSLLERPG